jgi:tetratricopeptide (TPR) repeat protein
VMNLDRIGKYRVVGKIGKGAMGEVYKAHDPLLNRYVALKTIAPALAADPEFKSRFQREAQSAAKLNHPNIITVYDFGEEQGLTYMVMELLEGVDLKEAIRARSLGHLGHKLEVMEQIVEGLAFAHARGVVHRDLKPGNIHLQPSGHVKILDFGLARLGASEMTKTGTVMGTPHYMSPEQVRGQKADARSDVFSLGAVFYEILCQHRPFEADSVHGVLFQILEQEPEPMRKWEPEVPAALVTLVERALSKDPARRFADAGEMTTALAEARDAIGEETIGGSTAGQAERTLFQAGDATLVEPGPSAAAQASVRGATALTLARAPAGQSHLPRTVRPDPTLPGGAARRAGGGSRAWLIGGGAAFVLVLGAAGGLVWMRGRTTAPALPQAEVEQQQVGILTEALVASQVELARADLANRDYAAAAQRAEGVLKLNTGNAEAQEVLDQARKAQRQLDAAAAEARAAFGRGDTTAAAEALGRVMALDPRHPVVGELSGELNKSFRRQAEESRRQTEAARTAAEQARASSQAGFAEGRQLLAAAETSYRREEFTVAAQKYEQARMAFERAKRESDEARTAAAAAAAAAAARPLPSARPPGGVEASSQGAAGRSAALQSGPSPIAPSAAPTTGPVPAPTISAALSPPPSAAPVPSPYSALPPAAAASGEASEAAVRRVIADYKRAIESQDLALFRSLKPDLSQDDEKKLRESFKVIKSWVVNITYGPIQVDGDHAIVKVSRQDTINGRPMPSQPQTFRLARAGGTWQIVSMGQ